MRSEEHTSELQSPCNLVCRLLLEKKRQTNALGLLPLSQAVCPARREARPRVRYSCRDALRPSSALGEQASSLYPFFFFNDTATTEIYTLSLHDALPIWAAFLAITADTCARRYGIELDA